MKKLTSMAWVLPLVAAPAFISGCGPVNADMENGLDAKIVEAAPADMPEQQPQDQQQMPAQNQRMGMVNQQVAQANVESAVQLPDSYSAEPGTFTRNPTTYSEDARLRAVNRNLHIYKTDYVANHHHHNTNIHTNLNTNIVRHPRVVNSSSLSNSYSFSNSSTMSETVAPVEVINAQPVNYAAPAFPLYGYGYGYGSRYSYFPNLGNIYAAGLAAGCNPLYGRCFAKALRYGFPF